MVFLAAAAPPAEAPAHDAAPAPGAQPSKPQANEPAPVAEETKAPMPASLSIPIDQTKMVELNQAVSTVSIGNPAITDVNIQNGRMFLVGKSFGRTNVVALSPTGETVLDMMVFVTSTGGGSVTVYKGSKQLTFNCAPNCDRTLMPGDSKDDFDAISSQMSTKMDTGAAKRNE